MSNNQLGTGGVVQHGARCAAALTVPKAPRLIGRGGATTTTTTTPPVTRPRPPVTRRPTPGTTTQPPGAPGTGGAGAAGWLVALAVVLALAVGGFVWRRRQGPGEPRDE